MLAVWSSHVVLGILFNDTFRELAVSGDGVIAPPICELSSLVKLSASRVEGVLQQGGQPGTPCIGKVRTVSSWPARDAIEPKPRYSG